MLIKTTSMTVPVRYVRGMVDAALRRGISIEQVLEKAGGIDARFLSAPRARISLKQFSRLYGAIVKLLEDESAGLSAYRIPRGAVETLCRVGVTATSLVECVDALAKALNAILHDFSVSFCEDTRGIHLVFEEVSGPQDAHDATYEVILLTVYATLAWLFGQRLPLASVDLPFPAPRHLFELRTLFVGHLRFNEAAGALRFRTEHASLPVVRTPKEIPKFLRRAPGSLIEALLSRGTVTNAVRKLIQEGLPKLLTLSEVAELLALSPRSLHRKLEAEGESFQKVKDELRRDIAILALTRSSTPLKQISVDLGFADQASFQRAFLQWTGRTPGTWRRPSLS